MAYDLPKIREQLKRKLPKLLNEKDTVSIIWFSGRGEFGTLLEAEPVATLKDLKSVEQAIDRWLKPIGLTGFTEPLQEAVKVVQRVMQKNPSSVNSLIFLSDGCDNIGNRAEILRTMESVAGKFQSTTIVEYGYYADRVLLSQMAERAGGTHIFAQDFDRYAPSFEAAIKKQPSSAPKVELQIEGDPIQGFVFALDTENKDLITYAVDNGKVIVPENTINLWYMAASDGTAIPSMMDFSENIAYQVNKKSDTFATNIRAAVAAVSLYAVRMRSDVVYPLLKVLGDVSFINEFSSCFGKQRYSAFQERAKKAAFGEGLYTEGYDPNKVPAEDAFTVLDLLNLLAGDENNRVLLDHSSFKYNAIGRGRVDANEQLSNAEIEEVQTLTDELRVTKNAKRAKEISTRLTEISNKPSALKFVADEAPNGYPISSLVFNEDRPNVSFMVRKEGTVDVSSRPGSEQFSNTRTGARLHTHIFRNYAVIKDGLINIDKLPVKVTPATLEKLSEHVVLTGGDILVLDLTTLPVINRQMVKNVSAKEFFELQYELLQAQAEAKVYNSFAKDLLQKERSAGLKETYGEDIANWLKEQGITDGGFSPKFVQADSTDFYMGKELKVSLKGYSSLPSLKEVKNQMAKGKLNGPGSLMAPTVQLVEDFLGSEFYKRSQGNSETLTVWLEGQAKASKDKVRHLLAKISQITFAVIVGQIWFKEFSSLDEQTLTIEPTAGIKIDCKVELKEVQIKI